MSYPDLTPDQIKAQHNSLAELRRLAEEGTTFYERRDDAIARARMTGLSLRQIGRAVGLTGSSVKMHLDAMGMVGPVAPTNSVTDPDEYE